MNTTTKAEALAQITKLEADRAACYDGFGGCNYTKQRKIDRQLRTLAIQALGWEAEIPTPGDRYIATTSELIRWARE